ncbi:hypothetical protein ANN_00722 [Periplaneta americana]|uniref:Uncharacterized protein n=1 Tax=Periplaneta americana TaxID=6978 RepID=A0ABQ8TRR3_PERAM|nr:hypothetical protein ANN_00722 [Periplaneta americana]
MLGQRTFRYIGQRTSRQIKAAALEDREVVYNKTPREVILTREKERGLDMWQQQWSNSTKGRISKAFFPSVKRRLSRKVPISPEFTAMTTGHGKLRAYLHRFRIIESPICPCGQQEQTVNHVIFDCNIVTRQRNDMIRKIQEAGGKWPTMRSTGLQTSKYFRLRPRYRLHNSVKHQT